MYSQYVLILCGNVLLLSGAVLSNTNHKFLGIGYNLLTGNPDGGKQASGGVDPGLLYTRNIFDLSHPLSVQTQVRQSCAEEKTTNIFYGTKSYQEKLKTDISIKGGFNAGLFSFAFGLSTRFENAQKKTQLDHKVFQDCKFACNLGQQRFVKELAPVYSFSVTENFAASVCALPSNYDKTKYMAFLDSWGTHITIEVELGTKNSSRRESTLAEFFDHVSKTSAVDVTVGGSYMGSWGSLKVNFEHFKTSSNFEKNFGSYSTTLLTGTPALPEPIGLTIEEIHMALDPVYWQNTSSLTSKKVCTTSQLSLLSEIQTNLVKALSEYAVYKMAPSPTDPDLKVPLRWPKGTYGLYKANTGCPNGNLRWYEGSLYQRSGFFYTHNEFSVSLHLAGTFQKQQGIVTEFCIKGTEQLSEYDLNWPRGDYCIAKYGVCPAGFTVGWLLWDDHYNLFHEYSGRAGSYQPDGDYGRNTKMFYCCRNDSLPTVPISLPTEKPFFLIRFTRSCQIVNGMGLLDEWVYWGEASNKINTKAGGFSPFDDGNPGYHKIHFCYYSALGSG